MKRNLILSLVLFALTAFMITGCKKTELTLPKSTLMDYESYKGERSILISIWDFPRLEYNEDAPSGHKFDDEDNDQILRDIKAVGVDIVNITGLGTNAGYEGLPVAYYKDTNAEEIIRELIPYFNKFGLKTVIYTSNHASGLDYTHLYNDFSDKTIFPNGFPDFSDLEGFYGFLGWDEPSCKLNGDGTLEKVRELAIEFDRVYSNTDAMFIVNLLPGYGNNGWGTETFDEYLDNYGKEVLENINNTKRYISLDTYPFNTNGTFTQTFLTDIAKIKAASLKYDAMSHVCLQASATSYNSAISEWYKKVPTRDELSLQAYSALAFGIDSISWYSYTDPQEGEPLGLETSAVNFYSGEKNEEIYNNLKSMNEEISTFDYVLKCFTWKGFNVNSDVPFLNQLTKQKYLSNYYISDISMSKTIKNITSIATPYIVGRMVDENGNEGFMISNFRIPSEAMDGETYTMTIDFEKGVNKLIIYQNGDKKEVNVNGSYELDLNLASGAFIIPYVE